MSLELFSAKAPFLINKLFYLPAEHFALDFNLPSWSTLFGNENPIVIEYCSGNGSWICQKALENPEKNWIAIEKKKDRTAKILSSSIKAQIPNLFVVCAEALFFTKRYLSEASVEDIYINFPDPWPKRKSAKHRLVKSCFVQELLRILKIKGSITFATDAKAYLDSTLKLFATFTDFESLFGPKGFVYEIEGYGISNFERIWREQKREIYYAKFSRR